MMIVPASETIVCEKKIITCRAPDNTLSGVSYDVLFTNIRGCGIISELTVNVQGGICE